MTTAVESSVLLDVLAGTPERAAIAAALMTRCADEGRVIVCEKVIAEITPEVGADRLMEFLGDWRIEFAASTVAVHCSRDRCTQTTFSEAAVAGESCRISSSARTR